MISGEQKQSSPDIIHLDIFYYKIRVNYSSSMDSVPSPVISAIAFVV
jgi:hypothetical protein